MCINSDLCSTVSNKSPQVLMQDKAQRMYKILSHPHCDLSKEVALDLFYRWENWEPGALLWHMRKGVEMRTKLGFLGGLPFFLSSLPNFTHTSNSFLVDSQSLMVHFTFTLLQMASVWSKEACLELRCSLKPGHFFKQQAVSRALQHWYYHRGEPGWGRVLFNKAG